MCNGWEPGNEKPDAADTPAGVLHKEPRFTTYIMSMEKKSLLDF
jgi:hypothetical protein